MSGAGAPPGNQGAICMAVVPYAAQPPFRSLQPDGTEASYGSSRDLGAAVRAGTEPVEFEIVVKAKIRPVLLLQDRPLSRFDEYAALQITSLENFAKADQETIRRQEEPALFYLDPGVKPAYGLATESVIDMSSLVRVRREALVGRRLGRVDQADFRTVCERLAIASDLDLADVIVREAGRLVKRLQERGGSG